VTGRRAGPDGFWDDGTVGASAVTVGLLVITGPALVIGIVAVNVRKSQRWLVIWWMGAAFACAFAILFTASAVAEARRMEARTSCVPRLLDFENNSVETVGVQWLPPRVQCEYGYSNDRADVVWESRWLVYLPVVFVPIALATVSIALRNTRDRRTAHRTVPTQSPVP
jgi:hypothetical protein